MHIPIKLYSQKFSFFIKNNNINTAQKIAYHMGSHYSWFSHPSPLHSEPAILARPTVRRDDEREEKIIR